MKAKEEKEEIEKKVEIPGWAGLSLQWKALVVFIGLFLIFGILSRININLGSNNGQLTQAQIEKDRQEAKWVPWRVGAKNFFIVLFGLSAGIVAVGSAIAVVRHVNHKSKLVYPNRRGEFPLTQADDTITKEQVRGTIQAKIHSARQRQVPQSLTITNHGSKEVQTYLEPEEVIEEEPEPEIEALTYSELLQTGTIGFEKDFYLGTSSDGPVTVAPHALFPLGFGGKTQVGKTRDMGGLITQAALKGYKIFIIDEHFMAKNGLSGFLKPLCDYLEIPTVQQAQDIKGIVRIIASELNRRKRMADYERGDDQLWLTVFDELPALKNRELLKGVIPPLVVALLNEGYKFGMDIMIGAQIWNARSVGGSEIKDGITSALVHKMKRNAAQHLIDLSGAGMRVDPDYLQVREAYYLDRTSTLKKILVPYNDQQYVLEIVAFLRRQTNTYQIKKSPVYSPEAPLPISEKPLPTSGSALPNELKVDRKSALTEELPVMGSVLPMPLPSSRTSESNISWQGQQEGDIKRIQRMVWIEDLDDSEIRRKMCRLYNKTETGGRYYVAITAAIKQVIRAGKPEEFEDV